jgi:lysophospholipase L1-like esterase
VKKFVFAFLSLLSVFALRADPVIHDNDTLIICGDSITAQHIYSANIEDYILMCAPAWQNVSVVQRGRILEKASDFAGRVDSDVMPFKPTVATTMFGMNDGGYGPLTDDIAAKYRVAQTSIVEQMKKNGITRIFLASPKPVDPATYNRPGADAATYNKTLSALADIDKDVAAKEGVTYVDIFGIFTDVMNKAKAARGAGYAVGGPDGVHPNPDGHLIMTYAFLKALGYDGAIATVTVDLNSGDAQATPGTKVTSFDKDKGVVNLECTRYPFSFTGAPTDTNGNNAGILPVLPFNQDFNRYLLVVKGVTGKAKVQWGGYPAQEYTGDELAKGVNLTEKFMDHPFHGPFFTVDHDVLVQEAHEERIVQDFLVEKKDYEQVVPGDAKLDQFADLAVAIRQDLNQAAQAAVKPIETSITVTKE